jgi:hypothetical protein
MGNGGTGKSLPAVSVILLKNVWVNKQNQIPRCKPNKRCERPLQGKLYTSEERDW